MTATGTDTTMQYPSYTLTQDEAKAIIEFLNRVQTQGIQEATNLVHCVNRLAAIAQRHPEEPADPDVEV